MIFTVYDAATVGNSKWTETQSITTSNGLFTVLLGTINPIVDTVFDGTTRYLSLAVAGNIDSMIHQIRDELLLALYNAACQTPDCEDYHCSVP
jgi:hypothetical protein